jgi:hypothetical protein
MHVEMPKIGHDEQVPILVREQALIAQSRKFSRNRFQHLWTARRRMG